MSTVKNNVYKVGIEVSALGVLGTVIGVYAKRIRVRWNVPHSGLSQYWTYGDARSRLEYVGESVQPLVKTQVTILSKVELPLNCALLVSRADGLATVVLDFKTKDIEVDGLMENDDVPGLTVSPHRLAPSAVLIEFPEFKGYTIWAAMATKYSIRLCLQKGGIK